MNAKRLPGLRIERLSRDNVEELGDFFTRVDNRYFAHASLDSARAFVEEPADIHVLGRVAGRVVAFGMLRGWEEGYETPSLGVAVAQSDEGRGYGRVMMIELEKLARERGATTIRLRVHPDHVRAQTLYMRCGYRPAGAERGEMVMVLDLKPK